MFGQLASMAGSAIAGTAQAALGIGQMIGGLFMPKPKIPDYEIPQEIYENMTDAEYWSFVGLPEAQKQEFLENSMRTGASALAQSASRKGGLGMVSSIAQQQADSNRQLLTMDAQARMQNIQRFWGARERMAQERSTQQQWKMDKVMYQRQKRDEMLGAGMQNLAGGFGNFIGNDTPFGKKSSPSYDFTTASAPKLTMPSMPTSLSS